MAGTTKVRKDNLGLVDGARREVAIQHNALVTDVGVAGVPLSVNTTVAQNTSTTETDLMSYSVAASKLANVGDAIEVELWGSCANNANTKSLKIYWAGTAVHTIAQTASILTKWSAKLRVYKTASNAQDWSTYYVEGVTANGTLKGAVDVGTATGTDTGALIVKATGTSNTATADILQEGMVVRFIPAAASLLGAAVADQSGTAITA